MGKQIAFKTIKDDITARLNKMVETSGNFEQLWTRHLKPRYQNYQMKRWKAQGAIGELGKWKSLSPSYEAWKKGPRSKAQHGGKFILILHGALIESVVGMRAYSGEGVSYYREKTAKDHVQISTALPYAGYVDSERSFTKYDKKFISEMKNILLKNLKVGI